MKSFIRLTFTITVVAVIFSACKKGNNVGKMIPKNALLVLHINTNSLSKKISWDEIKQTYWYKEAYNDTMAKPWMKKLMDNPANSGIDFNTGLVIFAQKTSGSGQIIFEGDIKDIATFEAFNKNLNPGVSATKDGDLNILLLRNESTVGWNKNKFAYTFNAPFMSVPRRYSDTGQAAPSVSTASELAQTCKNLFSLQSDITLEKNEKFTNLLSETGDIHYWQNAEELMKNSPQPGMMGMLKLDLFFKENISAMTANFEAGKINVHNKMYANAELTNLLKKYSEGSVNTDMIKNIPSQNITGLLALHFKPEGIKELMKLMGLDGMVNMFISQQGFNLDDFVKANKGDLVFAVTDFNMKPDSFSFKNSRGKDSVFNSYKPDANILFSVSIGDKPSFDKLVNAGKKMGKTMQKDSGFYSARNDKYFALGNRQENVSKYIAGGDNKFDFPGKVDQPVTFFLNIQKILTAISPRPNMDSAEEALLAQSKKMWSDIFSSGGEFKDGGFEMHTEINLLDKNINSLKQLNSYADIISKVVIEKKKKQEAQTWSAPDSAVLTPPLDKVRKKREALHH